MLCDPLHFVSHNVSWTYIFQDCHLEFNMTFNISTTVNSECFFRRCFCLFQLKHNAEWRLENCSSAVLVLSSHLNLNDSCYKSEPVQCFPTCWDDFKEEIVNSPVVCNIASFFAGLRFWYISWRNAPVSAFYRLNMIVWQAKPWMGKLTISLDA